ncbi:D-alanine--D-alanine ligase [Paenibacillus thermoaerophilus]|uniref:D-alanine--D-alanine ligase n=1 Tax=Paenibacillus thermoaerophilus TaxID=1215385 RepID=A0ABW2V579_9BACL|nr:D-alanine--D-alanine ligase [Paenibacillus thermoaerophilus]TMV18287.1 D-alanine--D-alanine ligase [Paenibacillus thermoaerophilus]
MTKKIRIGLIYGGKSGEHDVSLLTAHAVIQAFDFSKYEVIPFYITKQGEWRRGPELLGPVGSKRELAFGETLPAAADQSVQVSSASVPAVAKDVGATALAPIFAAGQSGLGELDVVFPLLHGTYGEDGTIQGMFEMAGIPYVGAGVLASAVGMDKTFMKAMFAQEGLPQCVYRHFTRTQWESNRDYYLTEIEVALGYPCFVKPANLGSSVGVSKASNREELLAGIQEAFRFDRKVIVEEFVDAREIEVSVLGNEHPVASVPGEIVSSGEFYDYRAKYIDGKSAMIIPADLPDGMSDQIRQMAIRAFQAIDGSGLSRVDFFVRRSDNAILINEINTMPGFTPYSMYPLLWKESGKPYRELLDDLIRLAIERHEAKQQLTFAIDIE